MIGRTNRFHGLGSLRPIYRGGQTARTTNMAIKYQLARKPTYRAAVVVSKKVNKSAVVRNRIRRRVFELVRTESVNFAQPYDFVITIYHDQVAELTAAELAKTLKSLFRQAGMVS
jgi:ribonuclease P protein component